MLSRPDSELLANSTIVRTETYQISWPSQATILEHPMSNAVILGFMRWWNTLALRNGKLKFRTQPEAAEFVRRVQNEKGGPQR